MNDFEFSGVWLTLGWLLIFLVVFFSLSPKPPEMIEFEQGDKFGHLVAYLSVMLWFANIYPGRKQRISLSLAFFAMGAILESLQGLSGYRTFQYSDIVANSMGILFGWLLTKTWFGTFLAKLDRLLISVSLSKTGS